ncbi:MAG: flavin-containing monooxygenase [Myxococcota bacterium]
MGRTDVIVIGGGQAGLAMSRCLSDRGIEHVVLERGRVGERWRSERWASLRLLTPSWQSRLPGFRYQGPDPNGFMRASEVVALLNGYARSFAAPVQDRTTVLRVEGAAGGYVVTTDRGVWWAPNAVLATGECDVPAVPAMARRLAPAVRQLVPSRYRGPDQLPAGEGVLVVGASATGLQLADEIHRSGRPVVLSVGRHTRVPRCYRGHDIMWWLDRMGVLDERADQVADLQASRRQPSLQLVGRPDRRSLDLGVLQERGVLLAGRAIDAEGGSVRFAEDLARTTAAADEKLRRLLGRIDAFADAGGAGGKAPRPVVPDPVLPAPGPTVLRLRDAGIRTVLWATGYRRDYRWLGVPVLDARGELRHRGGVTPAPGLYALGLRFMRRRNSNFIDGVGDDARVLARHIAGRLAGLCRAA